MGLAVGDEADGVALRAERFTAALTGFFGFSSSGRGKGVGQQGG